MKKKFEELDLDEVGEVAGGCHCGGGDWFTGGWGGFSPPWGGMGWGGWGGYNPKGALLGWYNMLHPPGGSGAIVPLIGIVGRSNQSSGGGRKR
jgi:hypothetical protein